MRTRPLRLAFCGLAVLALCGVAWAGDRRTDSPNPAQLIDRLGSDEFAEREAAARALEDLGEDALDVLHAAMQGEDPDVRRRAEEIVQRVERRLETAQVLRARPIHLIYEHTPLAEAVADFNAKTGAGLALGGNLHKLDGRRVTLDTGVVSYWEAFDQFCEKAGVSEPRLLPESQKPQHNVPYNPYLGGALPWGGAWMNPYVPVDPTVGRLILSDGRAPLLPSCQVGAVRVRALPAHVSLPSLWLNEGERVLPVEVCADPAVAWHGVVGLHIIQAIDDRGQRLAQSMPFAGDGTDQTEQQFGMVRIWDGAGYLGDAMGGDPRHIPVRLLPGKQDSHVLRELRGVVTGRVQTPLEALVRVNNLEKAIGQTIRGARGGSLKIIEISRDAGGQVKVHGQIEYPENHGEAAPGNGLRFNRLMMFNGFMPANHGGELLNLELRDNWGQPFQRLDEVDSDLQGLGGPANPGPREFRLTYQPRPRQGEPTELVFMGRRSVIVEVPFVLHDVPMP